MTRRFSFLEFFAGGGMTRAGLGDAWRCLFANDFDSQKCAAYRANFGDGDLVETDINTLGGGDLPTERADLMWGSFPCQDLSLAGSRGGMNARRSGTFFAFWRLVEALAASQRAPRIIALENVTGLLTSNGGHDFAAIIAAMAKQGYRASAMVLDAAVFTPQSRPRLFILGFAPDAAPPTADAPTDVTPAALLTAVSQLDDTARACWIWLAPFPATRRNNRLSDIIDGEADDWHPPEMTTALLAMMSATQHARVDAIIKNGARRTGAGFRRTRVEHGAHVQRFEVRFDGLAGCLRTPAGGSSRQIIVAIEAGAVRTRLMNPREAARLMGLSDDYALPASTTAALKLCGDGVCAPVVQWLGENILAPALRPRIIAAA